MLNCTDNGHRIRLSLVLACSSPPFRVVKQGINTWWLLDRQFDSSWKEGIGRISTASGSVSDVDYSYTSRFEHLAGTGPEELVAAGLADCFDQALANIFGAIEFEASSIETSAGRDFGIAEGRPAIKGIDIAVEAYAAGVIRSQSTFCDKRTPANCTIAKILKIDLTMTATLKREPARSN